MGEQNPYERKTKYEIKFVKTGEFLVECESKRPERNEENPDYKHDLSPYNSAEIREKAESNLKKFIEEKGLSPEDKERFVQFLEKGEKKIVVTLTNLRFGKNEEELITKKLSDFLKEFEDKKQSRADKILHDRESKQGSSRQP